MKRFLSWLWNFFLGLLTHERERRRLENEVARAKKSELETKAEAVGEQVRRETEADQSELEKKYEEAKTRKDRRAVIDDFLDK